MRVKVRRRLDGVSLRRWLILLAVGALLPLLLLLVALLVTVL